MPDKELVNVIKWRDDPASQKVLERLEKLQDRAARLQQRLDGLQTTTLASSHAWGEQARELGAAEDRLARYGDSARQLGQRLDDMRARIKDSTEQAQHLNRELDELAEPRDVNVDTSGVRPQQYGNLAERTRALTDVASYFGGTEFEQIANVGADLLDANEAAGLLSAEIPKLVEGLGLTTANAGLLAGGITAAAAGVYLLYDAITDAAQKAREEAQKDIELLKSEEEGLAAGLGLTTDEINKTIQAQEQEIALRRESVAFYNDAVAAGEEYNRLLEEQANVKSKLALAPDVPELKAQEADIQAAIDQFVADFAQQFGEDINISDEFFKLAKESAEEITDTEIPSLERGLKGLTAARTSAIVVANDAAAAEEELFNTRRTVADQLLADTEKAVRAQAARQAELESIMPDDVDDILRGLATDLETVHAQQNRLNKLYRDGGVDQDYYQEQMQALNATERDLVETTEHYQTVAAEAARQNEIEAKALERVNELTKARHDLIKQETAAQEQAAQDLQRAAELAASYAEQTEQIDAKRRLQEQRDEEDFQRQRARDIANHYADLASIDAKYYESLADTLADLADDVAVIDQEKVKELADQNKDMQRLAKDHNKRMLQIARDLDNSQQDAVEERDVSAAIRNARQAQEDARNQNEQYEEERDRREEDFEERLKELDEQRAEKQERGRQALQDLKTQHQKERQQQIAAFNAEIALENQERRIKLQRQQEDYRNEDLARVRHYANQARQYSDHFDDLEDIVESGFNTITSKVQSAMNALSGSAQSLTVSGGGSARYVSGDGRAKKYGTGGKALPGQWIITGDTGTEMAKFNRDGSWDILNPRKTQQALSQSISLSVPVQIYDASSPAMIESVFETRVIPKLISAVRQAAPQGAR